MSESSLSKSSRGYAIGLAGVVLLGAALRFAGVFHDWPYSYYGDELHLMKRSIAMGTGDLNPHWFHKPGLLMYLLLGSYGGFFVVGRLIGKFASSAAFGAYFLSVGAAASPAGVSAPAASSSFQRLRLRSDHRLVGLRGVALIANRSSSSRFTRLPTIRKSSP